MADDRVTYTLVVDYTQNAESDVHYDELKAQIKERVKDVVPASKGMACAHFVSIADA